MCLYAGIVSILYLLTLWYSISVHVLPLHEFIFSFLNRWFYCFMLSKILMVYLKSLMFLSIESKYRTYVKQLLLIAIVLCASQMRWKGRHHFHFSWSIWNDTTSLYALPCTFIQREQPSVLVPVIIVVLLIGWKLGLNCIVLFAGKNNRCSIWVFISFFIPSSW